MKMRMKMKMKMKRRTMRSRVPRTMAARKTMRQVKMKKRVKRTKGMTAAKAQLGVEGAGPPPGMRRAAPAEPRALVRRARQPEDPSGERDADDRSVIHQ